MGVSKNNGTPKSSILIGFSIINHPCWGTPNFGNTRMVKDGVELTVVPWRFHNFLCKIKAVHPPSTLQLPDSGPFDTEVYVEMNQ